MWVSTTFTSPSADIGGLWLETRIGLRAERQKKKTARSLLYRSENFHSAVLLAVLINVYHCVFTAPTGSHVTIAIAIHVI